MKNKSTVLKSGRKTQLISNLENICLEKCIPQLSRSDGSHSSHADHSQSVNNHFILTVC